LLLVILLGIFQTPSLISPPLERPPIIIG
jgi:hypothetical protein